MNRILVTNLTECECATYSVFFLYGVVVVTAKHLLSNLKAKVTRTDSFDMTMTLYRLKCFVVD